MKYKELFEEALRLLNDLVDLQNGPPLVQYEDEWNETIEECYEFLKKTSSTKDINQETKPAIRIELLKFYDYLVDTKVIKDDEIGKGFRWVDNFVNRLK